ncbi:alpha,alpha-trehalase TreF [Roseivirga sp. E12]|uniref:alpha,alpha-trehalase TreF n=1 Tax=Roseivirga sp. E12 TaxID=2819237 RepID=UPI001ABC5E71|nr:alpha,alpha-trehalase TreF [Roseivirga sp. E12]MBO3698269.1 alpha,alpha-trehalase TreF [Roseivirga sp. E12]
MAKTLHLEKDLQELFTDLHASGLWEDGKEISDALLKEGAAQVLSAYRNQKDDANFGLKEFFNNHFSKASSSETGYISDTEAPVTEHINKLWDILARTPQDTSTHSTLIQLPHPYIVPGGRFNEIYYWDSYFTMLGLAVSERTDMIEDMVKNFAWMIQEIGFIPNGNRSYYLGRSQPPFFSLMVALLAEEKDRSILQEFLPALEKEYRFWMEGSDGLNTENPSHKRVVLMDDGSILNRHFDNIPNPRAEMYQDDVELIAAQGEAGKKTLLNIRAACESGWDFSSRWCADFDKLETIRTTDLVQVDLNCLLYHLEKLIASIHQENGDMEKCESYFELCERRKQAINDYFWNADENYYFDYNWVEKAQTKSISAAAAFPLFFELSSADQARGVAKVIDRELLKDGGLLTTNYESGQQWDAPNGWAPLQWVAIKGLRNYGHDQLAGTIKERWVSLNVKVFKNTGKLMEKYNVMDTNLLSGGGEYPVQDGFGWTNGVLLKLLSEE